jgi:hypothetical protein
MPVQLSDCTPGPKYSMMKPVPPCVYVSPEYFITLKITYPDCELTSQIQNHILRRRPSTELSSELDT